MNIAICSSASSYKEVITFCYELEKLGFTVLLPMTATKMKAVGGENDETHLELDGDPHMKAMLIREHFEKIAKSDGILVTNYEKHGKKNYIGPNVLMEMAIAFYLNKPIYVLNGIPEDSPFNDEILGLQPIFLEGDISKIST